MYHLQESGQVRVSSFLKPAPRATQDADHQLFY